MNPAVSKSLRERAEQTTQKIQKILNLSSVPHEQEIAQAIEAAIIEALLQERERCAAVAYDHVCEEDRDQAHKVAEQIRRVRNALAANLASLR